MNVANINLRHSMDVKDVQHILRELFQAELTNDRDRHIVFWYDEAHEFNDEIDNINLENVRVWKFSEQNLFATKYELEINDLTSHFLLYTNMAKPAPRDDWLFNQYKLGTEFTADKITIYMRRLGLEDDRLRPVFMEYGQFFNSNARFEAFRKYPVETYTEDIIDLNVLSALTKSRINTMDEILKSLFSFYLSGKYDAWNNIKKNGNEEKFWKLVERHYGYTLDRSLESLLTFFMMTYTTEQNVDINYPKRWLAYVSPRPTNAIVFMDQWMNHRQDRNTYNVLAEKTSQSMKIDMYIKEWDVHELTAFDAFQVFDKRIISYIVEQLTNHVGRFGEYEDLIMNRRRTHWYHEFFNVYDVLLQAIRFFALVEKLNKFIPEEDANTLFESYVETYYKVDTYYRKFYVAFDKLQVKEKFRPLRELIENTYTNWFIHELAIKWADSLERSGERSWFLPGLDKQNDFYNDWVKPYIQNDQRIFVIISDALRYEIGQELMDRLNNERKASTNLTAIQGVLPSYTKLGMASLLPHKELDISDDGEVFIDGIRSSSTDNRRSVLQKHMPESNVLTFTEINSLDRASLREACTGLNVVYIYHNVIDAVGDNPASETDVFAAADETMNDISNLINRLVNSVSASNILITTDHGFIYQRDKITMSQLIPQQVENSLTTNRRFILSKNNPKLDGTLTYLMDDMLHDSKRKYVTVPKGINRFQIQGPGANFVHGGAMLQEIVIPVITFKNDRSTSQMNVVRHVDVKLTNPTRKVTSNITYLEFFQMSAVEDKVLPLELSAYFVDEDDTEISNECRIIADSTANEAYERVWQERFIFKSIPYDRTKNYYLILEDTDGKVYEKYDFTVDIISPH